MYIYAIVIWVVYDIYKMFSTFECEKLYLNSI